MTVVPNGQVNGGVHPDTVNVIVPVEPSPQTITHESLVAVGGKRNDPPKTPHV